VLSITSEGFVTVFYIILELYKGSSGVQLREVGAVNNDSKAFLRTRTL